MTFTSLFCTQDHFLFDKPVSPLLTCAGMARDWPDARGIWSVPITVSLTWLGYHSAPLMMHVQEVGHSARLRHTSVALGGHKKLCHVI